MYAIEGIKCQFGNWIFFCALLWADIARGNEKFLSSSEADKILFKRYYTRWRISFDSFKVSDSESMGAMGVHYDLRPFDAIPNIYFGIGGYGALIGDRGGFFTGGITIGWQQDIVKLPLLGNNSLLEIGIFAGAGGGHSAFPGGGTMLRAHLVLEKYFSFLSLRAGIANTYFPNTINPNKGDTHITAGISVPIEFWLAQPKSLRSDYNKRARHYTKNLTLKKIRITPAILNYIQDNDAKKRTRTAISQSITLAGIQVNSFFYKSFLYAALEAYGAGWGGVDGYAKVLCGAGFTIPLFSSRVSWDFKMLLGMSGGGYIDTGGGLIIQPMSGFIINLFDHWSVKAMVGRTMAPDGKFNATTFEFGLTWAGMLINPKSKIPYLLVEDNQVDLILIDFSIIHKTYLPSKSSAKKGGIPYAPDIQQFGLCFAKPINIWLALTGSTFGAWRGFVGAYAEGLFGIKITPVLKPFPTIKSHPIIHYEIGVGGGGGMDVGSGLIQQWTVGWEQMLSATMGVILSAGKMSTVRGGSFNATIIRIAFTWGYKIGLKKES